MDSLVVLNDPVKSTLLIRYSLYATLQYCSKMTFTIVLKFLSVARGKNLYFSNLLSDSTPLFVLIPKENIPGCLNTHFQNYTKFRPQNKKTADGILS